MCFEADRRQKCGRHKARSGGGGREVGEYQASLKKHLPISERVSVLEKVAQKVDSNPFAALKAVQRADQLDDIVTLAERGREQKQTPEHRPIFTLPPGIHVRVSIDTCQAHRLEIDVTPEKGVEE
jgi:hypothetical protein